MKEDWVGVGGKIGKEGSKDMIGEDLVLHEVLYHGDIKERVATMGDGSEEKGKGCRGPRMGKEFQVGLEGESVE